MGLNMATMKELVKQEPVSMKTGTGIVKKVTADGETVTYEINGADLECWGFSIDVILTFCADADTDGEGGMMDISVWATDIKANAAGMRILAKNPDFLIELAKSFKPHELYEVEGYLEEQFDVKIVEEVPGAETVYELHYHY